MSSSFISDESLVKLFPLRSINDVVQFFRLHLEDAIEPDLTLLSIVTGIIENTLTSKCGPVASAQASQLAREGAASPVANNNTKTAINKASANGNAQATQSPTLTQQQLQQKQSVNTNGDSSSDPANTLNTFPVVDLETVQNLYEKFHTILSIVDDAAYAGTAVPGRNAYADVNKRSKGGLVNPLAATAALAATNKKPTTTAAGSGGVGGGDNTNQPTYATREIIKRVSDVIWHSLIRSTYKDRAHLQSLYSYLALNKLDCFGVAFAVVAGCQMLGYSDVHLAISEDHAWVVFGKTCDETIEVTWHGKGAEDKRGQSVIQGYESHSWLYLAGNPVVCDRYIEAAAIVSSINPSLSMTSAALEVAELQQQLLWLLYDMQHLQRYPMGLGCLGELEEVSATPNRPSCETLYAAAVNAAQLNYKNHHVYPYTYQGGYHYRQQQYKEAFAAWANAGDVIRLYNYSRDDEEIYKEFLDIANELIPHVMKTESSGHSAKSVLRDPLCFANLLRFYDGICRWEEGSQTPILHIGWAKPLVTTISRFDYDIRSQVIINCAKDDEEVNGAYINARPESNNNITTTKPKIGDGFNAAELLGTSVKQKDEKKPYEDNAPPSAETVRTTLVEVLAAACGEKILNPDFLLQGDGQPFADQQNQLSKDGSDQQSDKKLLLIQQQQKILKEQESELKVQAVLKEIKKETDDASSPVIKSATSLGTTAEATAATTTNDNDKEGSDMDEPKPPVITLYSQKMKGLKDLLLAEKLNTHAISLQVTAQSQVQVGKKGRHSLGSANYSSSKRTRRE